MEAAVVPGRDARAPAASQPSGCGKHNSPERKVYMDYNATTPLEPEVIQAMTEAMWEAWGNPSSPYSAGRKAKDIINAARESLAKMIGGKPQDIIFTSGGTEAAELVTQNCEAYEAHMRDVRDYLEERLEAEFGQKRIHLNSQFPGTQRLPNTCNFSIRGPRLQGHVVLAQCRVLMASVGAACHSDHGDQPSPVLL
ncbi:SCLY isoform 5, partial [Pongo abelii]